MLHNEKDITDATNNVFPVMPDFLTSSEPIQ